MSELHLETEHDAKSPEIPEKIFSAFPDLSDSQREAFTKLMRLYPEWNEKINVISRKDIGNLEVNHILHSLAIGKFIRFTPGSKVLDFGTGGGFPGIPLAILFPDTHFHLIDRIGKKIKVASEIAKEIGLNNVTFQHGDIKECKGEFDFVVSRAVMPQPELVALSRRNISRIQRNGIPNGIIALKGGDLHAELRPLKGSTEIVSISNFFNDPRFKEKAIVYTSL